MMRPPAHPSLCPTTKHSLGSDRVPSPDALRPRSRNVVPEATVPEPSLANAEPSGASNVLPRLHVSGTVTVRSVAPVAELVNWIFEPPPSHG